MKSEIQEYRLLIDSDPQNIDQVESFIDTLKDEYGFGDDLYGNVLISLTEAVNNAILHGNKGILEKKVLVTACQSGQFLVVKVKDEGTGFDYNSLPDPTAPENLENLTGRGVFLMKQLSDLLVFSSSGNLVELHFKL